MTISFGRSDVRCKGSPPPRWGRVGWGWSCHSITAETKGIRSPEAPLCTKKKILYLRSRARQRAEVYGARMPAATTFERASPPPNPPPSRERALLCRDMQGFLRDTTLATRPDAVQCPTPREVLESLADFYTAAKALGDRWHGQAPWADLVLEAIRVGRERGL